MKKETKIRLNVAVVVMNGLHNQRRFMFVAPTVWIKIKYLKTLKVSYEKNKRWLD